MANLDFYPGQKVVCVDDTVHKEWHIPGIRYEKHMDGLKRGSVYTVCGQYIALNGNHCIELREIVRPIIGREADPNTGYNIRRFRPLEEQGFKSEWVENLKRDLKNGKPVTVCEDA